MKVLSTASLSILCFTANNDVDAFIQNCGININVNNRFVGNINVRKQNILYLQNVDNGSNQTKRKKGNMQNGQRKNQTQGRKTNTNKGHYSNKNTNNLAKAKAVNKKLIESESAQDVLKYFISQGGAKIAGGDAFNSVNFSTCFHRLARFATYVDYSKGKRGNALQTDNRKAILSDPRTAILMSSLAEALVQPHTNKMLIFNNRELTNVGWAIAKLKLAPNSKIYPIVRASQTTNIVDENDKTVTYAPVDDMNCDIIETSQKVRQQVLEVAKERNMKNGAVQNKWIPTMSQLSAKILDNIASQVLGIVHKFNSQELANLLYAFASAGRADVHFFDQLSKQLVNNVNQDTSEVNRRDQFYRGPKPQEFSNSIWAFASAGIRCDGQVKLINCVADKVDENNGALVEEFKPQELSNTAWGIATLVSKRTRDSTGEMTKEEDQSSLRILRWVAKSLINRVDEFKPQEISNSIWAFATLGFGATTTSVQFNTNNDYISLQSDQPELDKELVSKALLAVAKNAITRLYRFRPQELNNLTWGFCRLGHVTDEMKALYKGVGQEILKRHRQFAPQDIGTTLWSFATVEYFDEAVFKAAVSELTLTKSRSFKPQELSNTVWALATAGAIPRHIQAFDCTTLKKSHRVPLEAIARDPFTACFAAAAKELMRRPEEFKEQEIKDVLWSLSKVGMRHPQAFKSVAEHLVGSNEGDRSRGLSSFSPQGLGNLAWSFAKQAQLVEGGSESLITSTGRLAVYETISLDVGEDLIQRLFKNIAETSMTNNDGLDRCKPQDLSNTCWAFATLGLLHRGFLDAVGDQVERRLSKVDPKSDYFNMLSKFKAQEIANLVWAFATLNYRNSNIIEHMSPYINYICSDKKTGAYSQQSIARIFKRQEIANIAWSCSVLQQYPKTLMPLLYHALFGKDGTIPEAVKAAYEDDGMQRQALMTVFYVQMSLAMEMPEYELSLPPDFPAGWKDTDNINSDTNPRNSRQDGTNDMLQLTTSRLQNKVSSALGRQGFEHVEEHVISTDELERDHGVTLSFEKQEFLSIDIADVENLIGFEVDGPGHFITVLDDNDTKKSKQSEGKVLKTRKGNSVWNFSASTKQAINGSTALKDRLLQHLGWSVIHIPYWDWRDLKGDEDAEDNYIQNLLRDVK